MRRSEAHNSTNQQVLSDSCTRSNAHPSRLNSLEHRDGNYHDPTQYRNEPSSATLAQSQHNLGHCIFFAGMVCTVQHYKPQIIIILTNSAHKRYYFVLHKRRIAVVCDSPLHGPLSSLKTNV